MSQEQNNLDTPTRAPSSVQGTAAGQPGRGDVVGPYHLLELLGEGGFGHVWLAEQREPVRRRVALKLIKPGMDSVEVLARFEAERQALAMMDHPNVAKVFDAGLTDSGRPYFAMEYVQGEPITAYCDEAKLAMGARLRLFIKVCQAVQHAHQKGIIHRDLKPTNVLVTLVDGEPEPKVIDFGIAKAIHQPLTDRTLHTQMGRLLGTPEYMSPEQAGEQHGMDVDTRTDVYALGVVLYQLLTGVLPFDSQTLRKAGYDGIRKLIVEQTPPKPSTRLLDAGATPASVGEVAKKRGTEPRQLTRQIRGDLDWIVMKCLEKERARRYESVASLAQDIERHLKNEPVLAGPPSASYRAAKFVKRHRVGVGVGAAFGLVIVAGLIGTAAMYARAERERAFAVAEGDKAKASFLTAREEEAKANAAVKFVLDMFESIDPVLAQGREVLVKEVLGEAERKADELAKQPLVEATIRQMLGKAYQRLGNYELAVKNLAKAVSIRAAKLGPNDAATLESELDLAITQFGQGKVDDAERGFRRVQSEREKTGGPDDPMAMQALSQISEVQKVRDDYEGAEKTLRRVIEGQTRVLGPGSRDVIESRSGLADLLNQSAKFTEAEKEVNETVAAATKSLGENDPATLQAMSIKGAILNELGRTEEAAATMREVVDRKSKVFGEDHPQTLTSMNTLGTSLETLKRYEESEPLYRKLIKGATARLGPEHSTTLIYRNNLAQSLRRQKKFDLAEPEYRDVLAIQRRTLGNQAKSTLVTLNNLGLMLLQAKKAAEALPLLRETLKGLEATSAPDDWMVGASKTYVGECLTELGQLDEAEKILTESYTILAAKMGPTHDRAKLAAKDLAKVYEMKGMAEKAAEWKGKGGG